MSYGNPFVRDAGVEKPGIVGARWWNRSLNESSSLSGRRTALTAAVIVGASVLLLGGVVYAIAKATDDDDEFVEEPRKSIQLQRDYGWNFGAVSETVAFDQQYTQKYAREALSHLVTDLAPSVPRQPLYVQTLFESPEALPRLTLPDGDTARVRPLADALQPIRTPSMIENENRGRAYAALISQADEPVMTIVDLPGPDAVAFAAGAAKLLDPIFLFDNWPHPRGVVPAHLTLAAAVYHQPTFAEARKTRSSKAMPMAVIDRNRLNAYTDNAKEFDNRYMIKLTSDTIAPVTKILYVIANNVAAGNKDLDDINALFVKLQFAGLTVRAIAADAFHPKSIGSSDYIFGTTQQEHDSFFAHYPWKKPSPPETVVSSNQATRNYRPTARPTPDFNTIGVIPVVLAVGTGLLLGAKLNRNGSWNRSSGGYGG